MQKNFIAFIVFSVLVLSGWLWIQNQLWPPGPPPRPQDKAALKKIDEAKKPGLPQARWSDLRPDLKKSLLLIGPTEPLSMMASLGALLTVPTPAAALQAPAKTFVLGSEKDDSEYFLKATFTTRGAGVRNLTLTRFEAANWLGQPANVPLELVPDDAEMASFLMYHYPSASSKVPVLSLGEQTWEAEEPTTDEKGVQELRFSTRVPDQEHLRITKIYRLAPREYHLGLSLEIADSRDSKGGEPSTFRYQLAGAHGLPIEGEWYTSTFRQALIGMVDTRGNLWRSLEDSSRISHRLGGDRVPQGGLNDNYLQYAAVATQYFASAIVVDNLQAPPDQGGIDMRKILAWARPTLETTEKPGKIRVLGKDELVLDIGAGRQERYLMLPRARQQLEELKLALGDSALISSYEMTDGTRVATWVRTGSTPRPFFDDITVRVHSEPVEVRPGGKVVHRFLLYHGPVKPKLLAQFSGREGISQELVDRYTHTLHLRTLTDYGSFSFWSDLLIACTNVMHVLLNWLRFAGNGLSIILLTVIVRGLMFPISKKQAYFSIKMQELAPEMKKLQEKYKNDPQAKTQATMELYRKHDVHPLGGCLPIFLQMPIFIGLYYALQESIHFRLAPFLWIPNLAAPDMLLWWGEGIPWISDPDSQGSVMYLGPFLNLLPIVAVTLMIVQQKIMTPPPQDEQQAMQFKMMKYMMVFMGVMFYKVAAGLCIYFIASSLWGLAERQFLPRKKTVLPPAPVVASRPAQRNRREKDKATKVDDTKFQKVKDWWAEVLKQAKKK